MIDDEIDGEVASELDEREQELLGAYREQHAMPTERRDRVLASLVAGVPPGGGSALASASEPWVTGSGAVTAKVGARHALLVGSLIAASLTLAVIGWSSTREREDGGASPDTVARASAEPAALPPPSVAAQGSVAAPRVPEPAKVPALAEPNVMSPSPSEPSNDADAGSPTQPRVRARKRDAKSEAPSLGRERELIEQIHAALAEGDTATARARLDEHARDYPQGVFVQEREALDAIVRCKAGDLARGRELADEFLHAHPRAVLAARVRRTCKLDAVADEIDEGSADGEP